MLKRGWRQFPKFVPSIILCLLSCTSIISLFPNYFLPLPCNQQRSSNMFALSLPHLSFISIIEVHGSSGSRLLGGGPSGLLTSSFVPSALCPISIWQASALVWWAPPWPPKRVLKKRCQGSFSLLRCLCYVLDFTILGRNTMRFYGEQVYHLLKK